MPTLHTKDPEKEIMLFGDSNTYGYDTATGGRFPLSVRYPGVLQTMLGPNFHIIEEGLCGRTAVFDDPLHEGLSGLALLAPLMMSHAPLDTLIIMLGTNDTKWRFGCGATLIAQGITRLVKKALASDGWRGKPDVLVVCPTPITPDYRTGLFGESMGPDCDQKAAALAGALAPLLAPLPGVRLLDAGTLPGVVTHPLDGMHLTADAHRALANALAKEIQR